MRPDLRLARGLKWRPPGWPQDLPVLLLSIVIQTALGAFFGHHYDMRIWMATGYLVASGQNPYIPQDLTAVFQNGSFQGMTSVGYPPPWPLVLGLVYLLVHLETSNLLVYNLAIKLPIIAANIGVAYLTSHILKLLGADARAIRRARIFLLLSPFALYFTAAWGQFDSIIALLALASLALLQAGNTRWAAFLLALGISFKPTAAPILPVAILFVSRRSTRQAIDYALHFVIGLLLFCAMPFLLFGWDLTPILRGWNAHFTVAGAMSFMTFFELLRDSYQLPGEWWLLGLAWIPAVMLGVYALRSGDSGLKALLRRSTGLILVFFLSRTWLSEPNVMLILPMVVILTSVGDLKPIALGVVWVLPLLFTVFNASPPQLLFLILPRTMESILRFAADYRVIRLLARTLLVLPWEVGGWWIAISCFRRARMPSPAAQGQLAPVQA